MSCVNEPVIRSLWATRSEPNHLTGITGMRFDGDIAPEDHFLAELDTIDLHHGPYSTTSPYTVLEVIGAPLTNSIRAALSKIGFTDFTESQNRFAATRTAEEAMRLRD
jgi:hypothetical protein